MIRTRVATVWLDGCSGCHMSLLDMDERLLELAPKFELVYSPLVDAKEFPADVDVALVEGAVSSEEDLEKLKIIRRRSRILVSLGDCAVTANVPSMRNPFAVDAVLQRAYIENAEKQQQIPGEIIPKLLPYARPVHEFVSVDVFLPGCPPHRDLICTVLSELLEGRVPETATLSRFGA